MTDRPITTWADTTAALYKQKTGRPLHDWIAERRQAGDSWRTIHEQLWDDTGIKVSYETLRLWHGQQPQLGSGTYGGAA